MGILTDTDAAAIVRYCTLSAEWKRCTEHIAKYGFTYPIKDKEGNVTYFQQFPEVGIRNKLTSDLLRIEQQFGLTPAARTSIHVEAGPNKPATRSRKR